MNIFFHKNNIRIKKMNTNVNYPPTTTLIDVPETNCVDAD